MKMKDLDTVISTDIPVNIVFVNYQDIKFIKVLIEVCTLNFNTGLCN